MQKNLITWVKYEKKALSYSFFFLHLFLLERKSMNLIRKLRTASFVFVFIVGPTKGIANWSNLLFVDVVFADDAGDDGSTVAVGGGGGGSGGGGDGAGGDGAGTGVLTSKINFASGSFVVVESHTKPGVIFPSSVNDGRELRSRRKRNAFDASYDKFSINEKRSLIEGFVSNTDDVIGLYVLK